MSDNVSHIESLTIANFKRFRSFVMTDLGQFNLIFGDNNTGKTTLLEALLFEVEPHASINSLITAFEFRGIHADTLLQFLSYFNIEGSSREVTVGQIQSSGEKYEFKLTANLDENKLRYSTAGVVPAKFSEWQLNTIYPTSRLYNVPLVPFFLGFNSDLVSFYSKYIQGDRNAKKQFVNDLKTLVPDIEDIEPSYTGRNAELIVYQKEVDKPLSLSFFGDGTLKLFRILAEIVVNQNRRLMIDEVDTGIHFSRMKEFWAVILRAAKRNNVQLFMTTHSEECIRYFVDVLAGQGLDDLQSKARGISLIAMPDKSVKAFTYPFHNLEANISVGNEVRGGSR